MRDHEGLSFPLAEYERRLAELRTRMAHRHMDVAVITDPGNLLIASLAFAVTTAWTGGSLWYVEIYGRPPAPTFSYLQTAYDLDVATRASAETINRDVHPREAA
jgi:hypothetical protein